MYYVRITYVAMYNQMCDFLCVASNSDQNSSHQYFLNLYILHVYVVVAI